MEDLYFLQTDDMEFNFAIFHRASDWTMHKDLFENVDVCVLSIGVQDILEKTKMQTIVSHVQDLQRFALECGVERCIYLNVPELTPKHEALNDALQNWEICDFCNTPEYVTSEKGGLSAKSSQLLSKMLYNMITQ